MTQKDRVTNLFGFLMDLLEETPNSNLVKNTNTTTEKPTDDSNITNTGGDSIGSLNDKQTVDMLFKTKKLFKTLKESKDLMGKIDGIDKRNADELGKTRIEKKVTQPLIAEIERLKAQANVDANESKEKEELETIIGDVGDKMGLTIEDGEVKIIPVSSELRDNIPLDENKQTSTEGITEDLPQHIKDKLEAGPKLSDVTPKYGLDTVVNISKNDTTGNKSIVENNNEE